MVLWSFGPITPKQLSNALWWYQYLKLRLIREQGVQDGTALENVTGFIQVSNSMCREGELAGVTYIFSYSGFSVRQRTKTLFFFSQWEIEIFLHYSSGLFRNTLFICAEHWTLNAFMKQKHKPEQGRCYEIVSNCKPVMLMQLRWVYKEVYLFMILVSK